MMQELSIRDDRGNCRCVYCGKYRRRKDFQEQPRHIDYGDKNVMVHIHVAAACRFCVEEE